MECKWPFHSGALWKDGGEPGRFVHILWVGWSGFCLSLALPKLRCYWWGCSHQFTGLVGLALKMFVLRCCLGCLPGFLWESDRTEMVIIQQFIMQLRVNEIWWAKVKITSLASGFFPAGFKMPVAKHGDTGFSQETSLKTLVMGSVREPNYRLTIILPPLIIEVTTQYIHI